MRSSTTFRWLLPLLLGATLGLVLADAGWWHPNNGISRCISKVPLLQAVLYYPPGLLFDLCVVLDIGPGGNAAWAMYPRFVVGFWAAFGLLIGLWLLHRRALAVFAAAHPAPVLDAASLAKEVAQVRQDYVTVLHAHRRFTDHRSGLLAQARRILAQLPYFRRRFSRLPSAGDHEARPPIP